ncbi:LysR family transcriptional regulator [Kiloniella sp. b19]|uniref:LysR family transcriptional regulator n=1 Tax=Kiloniella sp. GXU_MW_B19 TaxID=3141326 RepID=UPI0031DB201F
MSQIELDNLRIFEAVARLGKFTAAATEKNQTQPAVSYKIRLLEEQLGVRLFDRLHRGVELTQEGLKLYRVVSSALSEIDSVVDELQNRSAQEEINLRTDFGFASFCFMPQLASFRERHPDYDVRLIASQSEPEGGFHDSEVRVTFGSKAHVSEVAQLLIPEGVVPVCSPYFRARYEGRSDEDFLSSAELLHLEAHSPRWLVWDDWLSWQGVKRRTSQSDVHLNTYSMVMQAALSGQGIALGWSGLVDDLLEAGVLVALGETLSRPSYGYWLDYIANNDNPAEEALRHWLLEQFAGE